MFNKWVKQVTPFIAHKLMREILKAVSFLSGLCQDCKLRLDRDCHPFNKVKTHESPTNKLVR